jgi:drug/metabolite transporter (DMT)-like permease
MKPIDLLALITLGALWGASFLFMRVAAPALGPIWLMELRVVVTALCMLPLMTTVGHWSELRHHARPLLLVGCINSAIPFSLLSFTSLFLPAGMTAILNGTAPLFGIVVAFLWIGEPLTLSRLLGLGLGFAGVVVLIGLQPVSLSWLVVLATLAGLVAALMYAIAAIYVKQALPATQPIVITAGSQMGASLCLAPFLPLTLPAARPPVLIMAAVLGLAVLSTACAYLLYFGLIRRVGASRALTVGYLVPLFAILWGALILREPITPAVVMGGCLILLGVAIANNLLTQMYRPFSKP